MDDLSQMFFGVSSEFDEVIESQIVKDNMNYLKSLSVRELTFRKKWDEIRSLGQSFVTNASQFKAKIWTPTDIDDEKLTIQEIENLQPYIKIISEKCKICNGSGEVLAAKQKCSACDGSGNDLSKEYEWNTVRIFCHSAEYEQTPGRYVKIEILHEDKILGFCAIASDIPSMKCRDEYIGWSKEVRMARGGLGTLLNSAVGTTIAPTQPFGYNFLGGKLIATILSTETVRNDWFKRYKNVLAGITTTSLYEQDKKNHGSQYDGMDWCWKKCGVSTGKVPIKPDESIYKRWHDHIKDQDPEAYAKMMTQKEGVKGPVTSAKMRVLNMIFDAAGIKTSEFNHGFQRGVYRSDFYENSREFLCGNIKENDLVLKPRLSGDMKSLLDWWKPKSAARYLKLKLEGKLKPNKLFYNKMFEMYYKDAKKEYFQDVGR